MEEARKLERSLADQGIRHRDMYYVLWRLPRGVMQHHATKPRKKVKTYEEPTISGDSKPKVDGIALTIP